MGENFRPSTTFRLRSFPGMTQREIAEEIDGTAKRTQGKLAKALGDGPVFGNRRTPFIQPKQPQG